MTATNLANGLRCIAVLSVLSICTHLAVITLREEGFQYFCAENLRGNHVRDMRVVHLLEEWDARRERHGAALTTMGKEGTEKTILEKNVLRSVLMEQRVQQ